jgi:hypothetical protein
VDVHATFGFIRPQPISSQPHDVRVLQSFSPLRCFVAQHPLISVLRAALIKSDVQEINRSALNKKDTELPFFWAYVDSADTTSTIVKVPMHCYYGDRGGLSQPRMSQVDGPMRANAPGVLKSMDRTGVVGFECVTCP